MKDERTPLVAPLVVHDGKNKAEDDRGVEAVNVAADGNLSSGRQLSFRKLLLRVVVFTFGVALSGLNPLISQMALLDPITKTKKSNFLQQFPQFFAFMITTLIGNVLSLMFYGVQGLYNCWNLKAIGALAPSSILYGISESVEMLTLTFVNGTFRGLLNQLKLPIAAVSQKRIVKRRQSCLQTILTLVLCAAIATFIYLSYDRCTVANCSSEALFLGTAFGSIGAASSILGHLVAERGFRQKEFPYVTHIAQLRVTTIPVLAVALVATAAVRNELHLLWFAGLNRWVFFLSFWLVVKDWTANFIVKHLGAFWVALVAAFALILTHVGELVYFNQAVDIRVSMCVGVVSVCVTAYAVSESTNPMEQQAQPKEPKPKKVRLPMNRHGLRQKHHIKTNPAGFCTSFSGLDEGSAQQVV